MGHVHIWRSGNCSIDDLRRSFEESTDKTMVKNIQEPRSMLPAENNAKVRNHSTMSDFSLSRAYC